MNQRGRSAYLLESLEARLLFSADLAPLPVDGGASGPEVESDLEISLRPDNGGFQDAETDEHLRKEIIFVDENVDDYQQLISDLEAQLENYRQFEVAALDSEHDGIAQISAYLNQHQDVDAVHIISHGADGQVTLGNSRLNSTTLDGYAEAIERWQRSLSSDADLLFYGCNLAASNEGQDLVDSLSLLTGADVAASDDPTGNAQFGGDWVLEYGQGQIETAVATSGETQQNWNGVLATFSVNTTADTVDANPGDGLAQDAGGNTSLRAAIMEANALGGANEIILDADTYTLTLGPDGDDAAVRGDLDVTGQLTITGAGAANTIIDANTIDRVFHVKGSSANLTLKDLTVTGGSINDRGGGIYVEHQLGRLTAERVIVTGNIANDGAGIFNDGIMTLTDVVISNNGDATTQEGGGIYNKEDAVLERVTISGNHADKSGGKGGGIHNDNTAWNLSLTNVTISGNSAEENGGGLHTERPVTIVNSTITLNSATTGTGGGIHQKSDTVDIENTIVAENVASSNPDVEGTFISQGNNLIGDKGTVTDFTDGVNGDQVGTSGSPVDPVLDTLKNNGGFTPTHALLAGSPAIDAGDNSVGLTDDQRRVARPFDGDGDATATIDIGAYEYTIGSLGAVNEFLVNDSHETNIQETSGDVDHSQRAVAMADDGSYVVVWSSDAQDASGWGVYAQRFDKLGAELTGEILVNEIQSGNERWARVVSDSNGNFIVTWTSDHAVQYGVYARRFDSSGTALGGEFRVNTITVNDQQDSSIAMDAAGNFVVVWEGQGAVDSAAVFYRRYDANGNAMDATQQRANLTDDGTERDASVAMNAAGDFVVVWEEGGRIKFQMFASDGTPGTASTVYIDTVSSNPDVAMDAVGNFVVVYRWNGGSGRGIWGHQFDTTGTEQPLWFRVGPGNNTVNKDHDNPSITMDDLGNFIVTYESTAEGGPGETVFAARFQSDKTPLGEFQVNQTTAGDQHMASIAMLDLDNYVVAFTGDDTDQTGVFARQYGTAAPNNAPTATNLTTTSAYNEGDATVAITDIVVSDVDAGETITATLRLTDTSTGSLSANDGATYDGGTGVWTITDTVANVNTALANLVFNPNVNNDVDTTISVVIDDGDEDASGPLTGTITLDVTPADITSDLIVHLEFSEGSGTTAFDSTAYGNDAYLSGAQDWVSGAVGGGFHFDYSNGEDFFEINNAASVENVQEGSFTLAAWFKADDVPPALDAYGIIVKEGWHTGLWYNANKQFVFEHTLVGPSYPRVVSANTYDPGTYHHIAVTLDRPSGTMTLYIDGVLENTSSFTPGAASWEYNSETWKVGTARDMFPTSVDFPAKGSVDDVRIYSRAITAPESAELFNLGNSAPTAIGTYTMASTDEDTTSAAVQVSAILSDASITANDPDGDTLGIAVFAKTGLGAWQYSTDGVGGWTGFGAVDPNAALLLSETTWLRYVPDGVNAESVGFDFRAWDQSTDLASINGTQRFGDTTPGGGTTAYSNGNASVALTVTAVNDAPVLGNNNLTITEGATVTLDSTMLSATDVDHPDPSLTFNVSGVTAGHFAFSSDTTTPITNFDQSDITASTVVFVHDGNEAAPSYSVSVTDGTDSTAAIPANITFTNQNDPPVLGNNTLTINEGGSVIFDSSNLSATDVDHPDGGLTFNISAVTAGQFERVSTGLVMTVFTQDDITLGEVRFVHDGSQNAPSYNVTVTDGSASDGPTPAVITFNNINDPGSVTIDNMTPTQGNTLTASVSDPDGATGAISYQWYRGGVAIGGATSSTYTTVQADVGAAITVTATYTDDLGAAESPTSAATAAVLNTNDPGTLTIDNTTPAQGDTLTANVVDPDGASGAIAYQWYRGGVAVGGATGKTYTTSQADVGAVMTVTADYTDDLSSVESLTSAGTAPVTNVNDAPVAVDDNLNATEDNPITFASATALLSNDSDIDGDTPILAGTTQPANGLLVDNGDGTLTYTPNSDFHGVDSFTYTISDGNGGTATGRAIIVVAPVGDTPQVTNASTSPDVQSGLIFIDRHASDGSEVTHFKISGITNGTLYFADGVTQINNGVYITFAQGQAGVKFTPAVSSTADGSFDVESSEDGISVASQSGKATSIITLLAPASPPSDPDPGPPPEDPVEDVSEEEVSEDSEVVEDVATESGFPADTNNMIALKPPQSIIAPSTAKPSLDSGVSFFNRPDFDRHDDKTSNGSILLSPQKLKMLLETKNLGELKTALGKLNITALSPADYELVRNSLDAIKDEIGQEIMLGKTVLGSAIATSVGLSAGYVVWMLKGGSLLASVLSSLPAWQLADPLAILVGKKDDEDDDAESLETIIGDGSGSDEDKESKASQLDSLKKESTKR